MKTNLSRRQFVATAALLPLTTKLVQGAPTEGRARPARLLFISQGKTGLIHADGSGLRFLEFKVPNQATWQPGGFFSDGQRILLLSMEPRRDGPGRPFDEFYTQTPTHLWIFHLDTGALREICTKNRMAVFYTPQLLLSDDRLLVQVCRAQTGQIYSMNLDGSDAREFTRAGDGFPYGLSLGPDGKRVAYHLATGSGYQIWTSAVDGRQRTQVAGQPGHLYFGPVWSPDGAWLAYEDCQPQNDPGHDWCAVCVSRPDGSERRLLTEGQAMWFAASYGNPQNRGGGSNLLAWTRDGSLLFPRRLPGSRVAWAYQAGRPDTDHFNRDYQPAQAHGGTEICRLDPHSGKVTRLTHADPPVWDFRAAPSPDGKQIVFCRAATGDVPTLWIMDADSRNAKPLTRGLDNCGVDHPRWLPPTR
jgi:TolB protein